MLNIPIKRWNTDSQPGLRMYDEVTHELEVSINGTVVGASVKTYHPGVMPRHAIIRELSRRIGAVVAEELERKLA